MRRRTWDLETLEGRRLPSQAVEAFVSLPSNASPTGMIAGPDGDLWVGIDLGPMSTAIDRIGPDGAVTSFPVPATTPCGQVTIEGLATGPDGDLWFDAQNSPYGGLPDQVFLGKMTPDGDVTEYPPIPIPAGASATGGPIVSGPGGELWFPYSEWGDGAHAAKASDETDIAEATTTGSITLLTVPSPGSRSPSLGTSLVAGSDGNLWFTENEGKEFFVDRMTPGGAVTSFRVGKLDTGDLYDGTGGNLLLTGTTRRMKPEIDILSTTGAATRVKVARKERSAFQYGLGPADGSDWFTDFFGTAKIGEITAGGEATYYDLSSLIPGRQDNVESIVDGPDGSLYLLANVHTGKLSMTPTIYRLSPGELAPSS